MLYVVSFCVAVLAACGMDRVVSGGVRRRYLIGWIAAAALFAVVGLVGGLTNVASTIAGLERADWVQENAPDVALGAVRSFAFVAVAVGLIWAISARRISYRLGAGLIVAAAAIDLWSIERAYWMFSPRAAELYATDATIAYVKNQSQPGRVIPLPLGGDLARGDPFLRPGGQANGLMIDGVRSTLGYHGNQLGRYNDLLGDGRQIANPNFWALTNSRYWLTNSDSLPIPGVRRVVGPVRNAAGSMVYLFELPGDNPLAWVAPAIVKAPDEAVLNTVLDPRFDVRRAALFDPESNVTAVSGSPLPPPSTTKVSVSRYEPGRISLALDTPAAQGSALLVAENYYPGWTATVNGQPAKLGRADLTLIGVELPTGARTVELTFDSAPYHTGKLITLGALALATLWWLAGLFAERRTRV
jgi:hypothetical protein